MNPHGNKTKAQLIAELESLQEEVSALNLRPREGPRAKEALGASEEMFHAVADYTNDWEYWTDPLGKFLYVSPSCLQITGHQPEEFISDPSLLARIVHPDDRERVALHLQEESRGDEAGDLDFRITDRGGTVRWIGHRCRHVQGRDGRHLGRRASNQDITDRYRMMERIVEREKMQQALLDAIDEAAFLIDPDGTVLALNQSLSGRFGQSMEGMIGESLYQYIPPDVAETRARKVRQVVDTGRPVEFADTREGHVYEHSIHPVFGDQGRVVRVAGVVRDITERRRAERTLLESEALVRQITETISEVFYLSDRTAMKFVYVSPAYERIWGRPVAEVLDDPYSFTRYVHPEDREALFRAMRLEMEEGAYVDQEYRIIRPDGEVRWIRARNYPVYGDRGEVYRVAGVAEDITGRKATESQRNFLAEILNSSPLSVLALDGDGRITYVNPAMEAMFGYPRAEMIGRTPLMLNAETGAEGIQRNILETISGGGIWSGDIVNRRKDGTLFPLRAKIFRLNDDNGRFMADVGFQEDITDQRNAESALREKTEELEMFFSSALDLLCIADTNGNFRRLNREWESLLGYRVDELEGRRFIEFVHPDDVASTLQAVSRLESQKELLGFVNRYRHIDGSYRWIEWHACPAGKIIYASARDISRRLETEERLRNALTEKETLLRELYHRTKNNMQVICAMLDLQADQSGDERVLAAFKDMGSRIRSMALVHQKLYQSKNLSRIDLGEYLRDLVRILVESYDVAGDCVSLALDLQEFEVMIDTAVPVGLVVNELVSNALKHAFPDGSTGEISIGLRREPEGTVELLLADNGAGVPAGFDFREAQSLGIQTVYSLVEAQLKGSIVSEGTGGVRHRIRFRDALYDARV
jgi:PAS domain S-box-containing protein